MIDAAVRFVIAGQKSADVDVVGRMQWWMRAKTALETAAACAESWPHMVGEMGRKLQVQRPVKATALEVERLGAMMRDPEVFERFRYLCQRDALYIVAMVRAEKEKRRRNGGSDDEAGNGND